MPTKRALDEDVFLFNASGPDFDIDRAVTDHEYLFDFIRKISKIPDLQFGEVKTLATYRFVFSAICMGLCRVYNKSCWQQDRTTSAWWIRSERVEYSSREVRYLSQHAYLTR